MQKRFWIVLGAFMSVGLLVAGLLYSKPSAAAPTISWAPSSITRAIVPGQTQVVPASFTASEDMSNAVVRVDPALQSVVKLLPSNLANVQKGQTITLSIVFSASPTALPGSFQGAIRLLVGSTTIVEPLPVTVNVVWPTFDGSKNLGITIATPPSWHVISNDTLTSSSISFSNVSELPDLGEILLENYCYFGINTRYHANPLGLSVVDWFDQHMRPLLYDRLSSEMHVTIDGHEGVQIDLSERGGKSRYLYVLRGDDVITVVYPLFAPQFLEIYQAMVGSLRIAP